MEKDAEPVLLSYELLDPAQKSREELLVALERIKQKHPAVYKHFFLFELEDKK